MLGAGDGGNKEGAAPWVIGCRRLGQAGGKEGSCGGRLRGGILWEALEGRD